MTICEFLPPLIEAAHTGDINQWYIAEDVALQRIETKAAVLLSLPMNQ